MIRVLLIVLTLIQICWSIEFYHSTQEINDELKQWQENCKFDYTLSLVSKNPEIYSVEFNKNKSQKLRGFLLFGEHPREMISPETGLNIVRVICENSSDYHNIQYILENFHLQLIVNANPVSRQKVEDGSYCLRENENGVDINRNYDSHWEKVEHDARQVSSGDRPFSEVETRSIRDLLLDLVPDYFITVHSGTLGLYTPYAYSEDLAIRNEQNMLNILNEINVKYCGSCDVGAAGKQVGYLCPGTSLDWVYDTLKTNYSFAMEIYEKGVDIREYLGQQDNTHASQLITQNSNSKSMFGSQNKFLQIDNIFQSDYEKCFQFFNPEGEKEYRFVTDNWTRAILRTLEMTAELENK